MEKLPTFFNLFFFFLCSLPVQLEAQENNPPHLQLEQIIHVPCPNTSTGSIAISVSGSTSGITYSWTGPKNYNSTNQDITGLAAGTYEITIADETSSTVYDEASFAVEEKDKSAPQITAPASKKVSTDTGSCVATNVDLGTATAFDNCTQTEISNNAPESFPIGETKVIWTVTDAAGNSATDTQIVTVEDEENPVIHAPASIEVSTDTGSCVATNVVLGTATASDNCTHIEISNNAPESFPIG